MKGKIKEKIFLIFCMAVTIVLIKQAYDLNNRILETSSQSKAYVAIIIDDFGYNGNGTKEMLELDVPFTAAVMPFLESSKKDAEAAVEAGKEVIVHMPMESHTGKKSWLGPRSLSCSFTDEEVQSIVNDAIEEIGVAVGMNNHMGSKITEDSRVMKEVLSILKENNMVFVDSMTTASSVTKDVSKEVEATAFYRDVFLDSTTEQEKVEQNLIELADKALQKGYAVGIGHVGPEGGKITAAAIKKLAPELQKRGIEFVTITELKNVLE